MNRDVQNIQRLAAQLRDNLVKCAADPDEDSVHDTRTGTRRLQATLEHIVRELAPGEDTQPVRDAAESVMSLLKKVRHAAGPVRDLDVHRKLLEKLTKRSPVELPKQEKKAQPDAPQPQPVAERDALERPEIGLRLAGIERQVEHLDAWLKHSRATQAESLQKQASRAAASLDKRVARLEAALREHTRRGLHGQKKPPAVVALDSFARLAMEMQHLDAGNLHDFRKGAKKARYVAELAAQGDAQAEQVAKSLKKLQDEIGDWHDWLVLAEEAHTALGDAGYELLQLIEGERARHFIRAMKTAEKLRGPLMGEWLALTAPAPPRRRPAAARRAPSHAATA